MVHLRGQNGHTQCGSAVTDKMLVLGIGGFRLSHSISPKGVCLKCLEKSRAMRIAYRKQAA